MEITTADGNPLDDPSPVRVAPEAYWLHVPQRFRDLERFAVERTLQLHLGGGSDETVKVCEGEVLVWAKP